MSADDDLAIVNSNVKVLNATPGGTGIKKIYLSSEFVHHEMSEYQMMALKLLLYNCSTEREKSQ
jgi:hypothetical protein